MNLKWPRESNNQIKQRYATKTLALTSSHYICFMEERRRGKEGGVETAEEAAAGL